MAARADTSPPVVNVHLGFNDGAVATEMAVSGGLAVLPGFSPNIGQSDVGKNAPSTALLP
jgi:hypothetical protein